MIDGFCQTGVHALIAFRADSAGQTPVRLFSGGFFFVPELNLVEIANPGF